MVVKSCCDSANRNVKVNRNGQATPLVQKTYEKISDAFVDPAYRLFLAVAWYTGERPQAILNLDVGNVYVNPKERKPRDTIIYPCSSRKDKKTREVPVHRNLSLALAAIYEPPSEGLLFPSPYNSAQPITYQAVDKAFRAALKEAGLNGKGYSLYSMRRGFITQLVRRGCDIKVIQRLTGHSSITSLMRYVEVSDEQVRNAIENF
jgi:integrase/recombinase XerD